MLKCAVEVGGLCLKLSTAGIHHFIYPPYSLIFPVFIHFFRGTVLHQLGNLLIAETHFLGLKHQFITQFFQVLITLQLGFQFHYILYLVQEPPVYLGELPYCFYRYACGYGFFYPEDPVPCGAFQCVYYFFRSEPLLADV